MSHGWVVLRTKLRHELLAAQAVSARGVEPFVPHLPTRLRSARSGLLFPGYVLARVDLVSDEVLQIRSAPGVAYVLPRAGPPTVLPDLVIDAIRARTAAETHDRLGPGDRVTVRSGPFRWLDALFDRRLNASGRVRILLELAQGSLRVEINEQDLERRR